MSLYLGADDKYSTIPLSSLLVAPDSGLLCLQNTMTCGFTPLSDCRVVSLLSPSLCHPTPHHCGSPFIRRRGLAVGNEQSMLALPLTPIRQKTYWNAWGNTQYSDSRADRYITFPWIINVLSCLSPVAPYWYLRSNEATIKIRHSVLFLIFGAEVSY